MTNTEISDGFEESLLFICPNEIIDLVATFLPVAALASLGSTCHHLRNLLQVETSRRLQVVLESARTECASVIVRLPRPWSLYVLATKMPPSFPESHTADTL
jgi:hypothetical protein